MKRVLAVCAVLAVALLTSACFAASVTLSWDLSLDDSLLGATGGYKVFQATSSGAYSTSAPIATVAPGVNTVTFNPGKLGVLYWVVQAYDSQGNTSEFSNEVSAIIKLAEPKNLKITK